MISTTKKNIKKKKKKNILNGLFKFQSNVVILIAIEIASLWLLTYVLSEDELKLLEEQELSDNEWLKQLN